MSDKCCVGKPVFLALGANEESVWGRPELTFCHAVSHLERLGLVVNEVSDVYKTAAIGPGLQYRYCNSVISLCGDISAARLLVEIKRIERLAGRRLGRTWGPRCLDIDILDYKGRILPSRVRRRQRGSLILPHPHLHERAFVLIPLRDVAPRWRHPVLNRSVKSLLGALRPCQRQSVGPGLAFPPRTCKKAASRTELRD
ncbi:MAG: 2-amino-4-hydroxy-6-hydroxymethyldihydropteridine diphosphokinase [Hyphomicrobiaceae bacterium]|nr:2-amino-4-hydroxy-6-hydroxymethyldihydropteridine diphosphokinase [Hyphomicrobiaceae bacterium]